MDSPHRSPQSDARGDADMPARAPGGENTGALADSAPRRTWLAAERTYLAWLRTGLGALGMSLAVGRLLPALIDASHVTFAVLGVGFGLLGIFTLVLGAYRAQRTRSALADGRPMPTDFWSVWALTAISVVLAVATVILVLAGV